MNRCEPKWRRLKRIAAACLVVAAVSGVGPGVAGAPQPFELVRALTSIQSDVVRGRAEALELQQRLILEIGRTLALTDIERFRESSRNRRAVVKYVLSGGAPAPLGRLISENVFPEHEVALAMAALAYAEGRKADADAALATIGHRTLPRSLAGHVALVKALVLGPSRQQEANALLDDARLLSPGTIVDEASLRRQIQLASSLNKRERVKKLTSRYLRRFPASQYSRGMLQQVAEVLGNTRLADAEEAQREIGRLLQNLPPELNHWIMGEIAEIAIGQGNFETTLFALDYRGKSSQLVGGEKESDRMRLYEGAALIVTDAFERARKLIRTTNPRPLSAKDRELLRATRLLADLIRKVPALAPQELPKPESLSVDGSADWAEVSEAELAVEMATGAARNMTILIKEASK